MDRIFFDTDILMDVAAHRDPFYADSLVVLDLCLQGRAKGACSALSFAHLAYLRRKDGKDRVMSSFLYLRKVLEIAQLGEAEVDKMLRDNFSDLEDSLQWHSAKSWEADYFITRNVSDFPKHQKLKVMLPTSYISQRSG